MAARARAVAPLALAALSAAAALSLSRVFASGRFVVPVLVAVALAHVVGAFSTWRGLPLWATGLLQVVALAGFAVVALGPRFGIAGVELGGSSQSLATQLERGWNLLRTAPPPSPVTDGALLLAVVATFVVAATADWLAFRRDTVLAAAAPALVLFVWAATLGTSSHRTGTVLAFATAAAVFLLVQNLALLDHGRSWLVSKGAQRRHWLVPAALLVAVAVVAGVVIAPVVPGAGADPILDFANTGRDRTGGRNYRTGIAPFVDVSAKLQNVDNRELFTVVAPAPDYWRVAALDRFTTENGGQWTLQAKGDEVEVGLPSAGPTGSFRQEFAIGPMGERWLPAAYRPVAIDLDDTLVVASSSTLVADAESVEGLRYTVDSVLPPDAASVTADMEAATAAPVPARLQPFTDVPAGMPDIIAITAREVVDAAGATTPYAQAAALRNYFRGGGFEYSLDVDPVDTPDAIAEFLRTKRGFCVQFSTAYAVMARSLGIPTRVAVGFTPGELRNGQFHVSAHDAHAWPEVWLAGMGWTHAFDPTPPADDHPESGGSAVPNEAAIPPPVQPVPAVTDPVTTLPTPEVTAPGAGTGAGTGTGSEAEPGATQTAPPAATPEVAATAPGTGASPWLAAVLAVLAVLAAIGAYVAFVLVAKARQRARRRTGAPGDSVQGAWDEALDRLHEARVATDPSRTPLELSRVVPANAPGATRPFRDLARHYTTARYSGSVPTDGDATRAWEAADALTGALDSGLGWRERWRRRLDPGTLRRRHHRARGGAP